jgi:hypothetical protein
VIRQARINRVTEQENTEKQSEPITQRLDKAEEAVKQTDEDLSKKLELLQKQKQLTFEEPKQ